MVNCAIVTVNIERFFLPLMININLVFNFLSFMHDMFTFKKIPLKALKTTAVVSLLQLRAGSDCCEGHLGNILLQMQNNKRVNCFIYNNHNKAEGIETSFNSV